MEWTTVESSLLSLFFDFDILYVLLSHRTAADISLSDPERYPTLLVTGPSSHYSIAQTVLELTRKFGWKRLSILGDIASGDLAYSAILGVYGRTFRDYLAGPSSGLNVLVQNIDSTMSMDYEAELKAAAMYSSGTVHCIGMVEWMILNYILQSYCDLILLMLRTVAAKNHKCGKEVDLIVLIYFAVIFLFSPVVTIYVHLLVCATENVYSVVRTLTDFFDISLEASRSFPYGYWQICKSAKQRHTTQTWFHISNDL